MNLETLINNAKAVLDTDSTITTHEKADGFSAHELAVILLLMPDVKCIDMGDKRPITSIDLEELCYDSLYDCYYTPEDSTQDPPTEEVLTLR